MPDTHLATRARIVVALASLSLVAASVVDGFAADVPLTAEGITVYRTCVLTATPGTTPVVADSYVQQDSADANFGTNASLSVRSRFGSRNRRAYVFFDLTNCDPQIPSSAAVKVATLRLFATALPSSCRTYEAFEATSSWAEGSVSWNEQPGTATDRSAAITIGSGCENDTNNSYVTGWDVTADAQGFVSEVQGLYGWMIRDDVEGAPGSGVTVTFASKDAGQAIRAPQLVVTYSLQ